MALADQLFSARRRAFVGRHAELALFEKLFTRGGDGAVAYVHGAGGVGKSTLLRQVAWLAGEAGRTVVWLDGRDLANDVTAAVARLVGDPPPAGLVLAVDAADRLGPPDRWVREEVLAALPGDSVVVIAGREPPPLAWRVDPGWRDLVRLVPLANLDATEGSELLAALGVPAGEHAAALRSTRGHPLALALVGDVYARFPLADDPQVVTTLLAGLLDVVPGPAHRAALEACAQVRVTTEPLLAALLDVPDARDLFDWLRGLSMMELGPRGLFPQDLARDALGAELRWRHPDRYAEIHRRAGAYYQQQFTGADPAAQQTVVADFAYLHRDNEVLRPFLSLLSPAEPGSGDLAATPAGPGDHADVRALVERHEGAASAAVAAHWLARQPDGLTVVRTGTGELAGCYLVVALEAVTPADGTVDPAVDRALGHLALRADERAMLVRFWLDADEYQGPSPVSTYIALQQVGSWLATPGLAATLVCYSDPDFWAAPSAYVDFARVPAADFTVGGHTYGVFAHDWRAVPPLAWLSLLAARETADDPFAVSPVTTTAPLRVLDADEFAAAVRSALADVGRPDRLAGSALLRSRLVAARVDPAAGSLDRGRAVQQVVQEAAAQLADSPRDRRGYRALHHTYLQPAGSQQRAAELLDLPISTFRRHLATGVERLTELLWQQEVAR